MTPKEMIDEGIKTNNLELIKQGYDLLALDEPPTIIGRPPEKKKKTKKRKPKKTTKQVVKKNNVVSLNDNEYFKYLDDLEKKATQDLINMGNGPVILKNMVSIDSKKALKEDQKLDVLLGKNKRMPPPRRNKVVLVKRKCTKCNSEVELPAELARLYNYDRHNQESDKPYFTCGSC